MSLSRKSVFVAIVAMVMLAGNVFPSGFAARSAFAGSNGQQVNFTCQRMTYGVVKGYNQAGRYVEWQGSPQGTAPLSRYFRTSGWYWVGNVRIYWYYNGVWNSKVINVPKSQGGDITYASC